MRVFNKSNRLFQLECGSDKVLVAPRKLIEIEDRFTNDITYKQALAAGDIEELTGAKVKSDAKLQEKVIDTDTEKPVQKVQHPDDMDSVEAKRKTEVATGKTTRRSRKE